jgi:hypothetical protein
MRALLHELEGVTSKPDLWVYDREDVLVVLAGQVSAVVAIVLQAVVLAKA